MKPTPEEKCEGIILTSNDVGDDGGYYAVYKTFSGWGKTAEDAYRELCVALSLVIEVQNEQLSPSPEARCKGCGTVGCTMHNDEPEARVDWGREAEIVINAIPADCEDDYFQMSKTIIKNALQAAFEKGREAR